MIFLLSIILNKCLVNNILFYLIPVITKGSRPTRNGILWVTNVNRDIEESRDISNYENPVTPTKAEGSDYKTPEKRKVDDTLTMHTTDMMSVLKSSVIKPQNDTQTSSKAMKPKSLRKRMNL